MKDGKTEEEETTNWRQKQRDSNGGEIEDEKRDKVRIKSWGEREIEALQDGNETVREKERGRCRGSW